MNTANATDARADAADASMAMQASAEALGNSSLSGAHPQLQQEQASPRDKPPPSERKGHAKKEAEKAKAMWCTLISSWAASLGTQTKICVKS